MGRKKILIPESVRSLLGTLADREIARRAGVCTLTARKWRLEVTHGFVPPVKHRKATVKSRGSRWPYGAPPPSEVVARLGKDPDVTISKEVGASLPLVRHWRQERGIPARPRGRPKGKGGCDQEHFLQGVEERYPGMLALFGALTDGKIAVKYGISRSRTHQIRQRVGSLSYRDMHEPPWGEIDPLFRTMSDFDIHRHTQVCWTKIKRRREELGIPPHPSLASAERVAKMEVCRHLLGTMSDMDFAKVAGVGRGTAHRYRKDLGIKPFGSSPKCKDFKKVNRDEVRRLFWEDKTDEEIAAVVGCMPGTIQHIRKEMDLLRGPLGKARMKGGKLRFVRSRGPAPRIDRGLIQKLFNEGKSDKEIALAVGSTSTVSIAVIRRKELGLRRPSGVQVKKNSA